MVRSHIRSELVIDLKRVREIVNENTTIAIGPIEEPEPTISYAVQSQRLLSEEQEWRVNISYTPKPSEPDPFNWQQVAALSINAETGVVTRFQQGRSWTF